MLDNFIEICQSASIFFFAISHISEIVNQRIYAKDLEMRLSDIDSRLSLIEDEVL